MSLHRILCGLLLVAGTSRAQPQPENTRAACTDHLDNDFDGHEDCDDQDCQDFAFCQKALPRASEERAKTLGNGTKKVVGGGLMLGLGVLVLGASGGTWWYLAEHGLGYNDGKGALAVSIVLDLAGVALLAAGSSLLAIGAGQVATVRQRQASLVPQLAVGPNGFLAGVGARF